MFDKLDSRVAQPKGMNSNMRNRILIIDDDPTSLLGISNILKEDYDVSVAKNGVSGIEAAKKTKPNLILLDIMMPEMDGYEVIVKLKASDETKSIPVIFLTGKTDEESETKGLMLGAADYVTKPCRESALKLRITNLLQLNFDSMQKSQPNTQEHAPQAPSTNFLTHKYFNDTIVASWANAVSNNSWLSLALFQLSKFESIVTKQGHQEAEQVLQNLAQVVLKTLGETVEIARWSGDILAVIIPHRTKTWATMFANRLKDVSWSYNEKMANNEEGHAVITGFATASPSKDTSYTLNNFMLDAMSSLSNAKHGITLNSTKLAVETKQQNAVVDIILAFNKELKYEDMLDMLITKMMALSNSDAGTLYLIEGDKLHFSIVKNTSMGISNTMEDVSNWPSISLDETNVENISAYSAIKREVVAIEDVYSNEKFNFQGTKNFDNVSGYRTQSMLVLPLIARNEDKSKILGVIQLINATDPATGKITAHENTTSIQILTALSQIAANALENIMYKQRIVSLHDMTMRDALTGLGNRRYFDSILNKEWEASLQNQQRLSFLIMDIDYFKKVNDTYGHVSGDMVLKGVANVLKSNLRTNDYVARWGGEEFAVILTNSDLRDATRVAESLRAAVERTSYTIENDDQINATISIGINSIIVSPYADYNLTKFLSDADAALYNSKKVGRNYVSVATNIQGE